MKASEILAKYAAGERNFHGVNLRGQSFKAQNLSGVDLSQADIHGVDFTYANLSQANLSEVKAGLTNNWVIFLLGSTWLLQGLLIFFVLLISYIITWVSTDQNVNIFSYFYSFFSLCILSIVTIWQGLVVGFLFGVTLVAIFIALLTQGILTVFASFIAIIAISTVMIVTIFTAVNRVVNCVVGRAFPKVFIIIGNIVTIIIGIFAGIVKVASAYLKNLESNPASQLQDWQILVAIVLALILFIIFTLLGNYIGNRAIKKNRQDTWIANNIIALTALIGTRFINTNLNDVDLSNSSLKNTTFKGANLYNSFLRNVKEIDLVDSGETYLKNSQLMQVLITREGQNINFDRQDLRHVNLSNTNLENASFIDADFYQANLQRANLSRTILVRSNFERADLRGANLTGSCIQDWVITESTKLEGIICDYIYLKWVDGDKRDQMPPRGKFKPDGFVTFARYILETVELYHEKDINPRLALTVLQKMSRDYDEPLDILALGKKGERVFIQVKVSENIPRENFKDDYYHRYDKDLKLWSGNINYLPPAVNSFIEERINEIALENTDEFVFVDATYIEGNYTEINQGEFSMNGDRNINIDRGNYNERIEGDYMQGNSYSITGDNNQAVQGDNNQVTQESRRDRNPGKEITQTEVIELLAELEQKILSSELPEETRNKTLSRLNAVSEDVKEAEPDKQLVAGNLKRVTENLSQATKATEEGKKLWNEVFPILKTVGTWVGLAGSFFSNLL